MKSLSLRDNNFYGFTNRGRSPERTLHHGRCFAVLVSRLAKRHWAALHWAGLAPDVDFAVWVP